MSNLQNTETEAHTDAAWTTAPAPKAKKKWFLPTLIAVLALALGLGAGAAVGSSKIPDTVEVEVEKVVEKEVEVEVPVTPSVCVEAISLGGDVISSATRALGYSNDALIAAGNLDAAGITESGSKTEAETSVLEELGPKYQLARDTCLATAR